MPNYKYLIVGGGMTAAAAVQGIRLVDKTGTIGLIGAEPHPPYDRPPLSKGLWKGRDEKNIWRDVGREGITLHLGRTAVTLDPQNKSITDDQGTQHTFSRLLLATGGKPRRLPHDVEGLIYFRTLDDYRRLRALSAPGRRVAVVGGGFIGSEIAAALSLHGVQVVMVFAEERIGGRLFPAELGSYLNGYYAEKGIEVVAEESVLGVAARPAGGFVLTSRHQRTGQSREIAADAVVVGIGIEPNVELALAAGLKVENGIQVDSSLRTSHRDIYAAGDVANFFCPALGKRIRVEHEDNANTMGRTVGEVLAGRQVSYNYLPYFYSDLFDLGYEAVGEIDATLDVVADWKEPCREGIVYYLRDGRVRGVLLWNVWGQLDAARQLIAEAGPFQPSDLRQRLPI